MNPLLQTEKLCKWYGNILGVIDLDLAITPGIKGLLGPNGAGKSTFLKLISGQLKPSRGTLRLFGEPVFDNPLLFKRVGFCPEYDSYYSEMSGWDFILFLAQMHGFRELAREKAEIALTQVGLMESRDRLVKTYSFGMRQRLRIAASIVHEPELLLLDEPLRGIDPLWRIRLIRFFKEYEKKGNTLIVSSHILPEIEAMTTDIILIHQGKIFAEGDINYIRSLIDAHPHQISIRSSQRKWLAEQFVKEDFIRNVHIPPDSPVVVFQTAKRELFFARLMDLIAEHDIDVEEITSPDDNLQAIFDYLIGR